MRCTRIRNIRTSSFVSSIRRLSEIIDTRSIRIAWKRLEDVLSFQKFFYDSIHPSDERWKGRGLTKTLDGNNNKIYDNTIRMNGVRKGDTMSKQPESSSTYGTGRTNGWASKDLDDTDGPYSSRRRTDTGRGSILVVKRGDQDPTYQRTVPSNAGRSVYSTYGSEIGQPRYDGRNGNNWHSNTYGNYPVTYRDVGVTANFVVGHRPLPGLSEDLFCHRDKVHISGDISVADVSCQANLVDVDEEYGTVASATGGRSGGRSGYYAKAWSSSGIGGRANSARRSADVVDSYSSRPIATTLDRNDDQVRVAVEQHRNSRLPAEKSYLLTTRNQTGRRGDEFSYRRRDLVGPVGSRPFVFAFQERIDSDACSPSFQPTDRKQPFGGRLPIVRHRSRAILLLVRATTEQREPAGNEAIGTVSAPRILPPSRSFAPHAVDAAAAAA